MSFTQAFTLATERRIAAHQPIIFSIIGDAGTGKTFFASTYAQTLYDQGVYESPARIYSREELLSVCGLNSPFGFIAPSDSTTAWTQVGKSAVIVDEVDRLVRSEEGQLALKLALMAAYENKFDLVLVGDKDVVVPFLERNGALQSRLGNPVILDMNEFRPGQNIRRGGFGNGPKAEDLIAKTVKAASKLGR